MGYLDVTFKVYLLNMHLDAIRMCIYIVSTKCNYCSVFALYLLNPLNMDLVDAMQMYYNYKCT